MTTTPRSEADITRDARLLLKDHSWLLASLLEHPERFYIDTRSSLPARRRTQARKLARELARARTLPS